MTAFRNPLNNEHDSFIHMCMRAWWFYASRSEGRKLNGSITEARAEAPRRKLDGSTGGSKNTHTHTRIHRHTRTHKHAFVPAFVCLLVFFVLLIAFFLLLDCLFVCWFVRVCVF